ncbi:class I SAM-dependent methyltransferase [Oceanispirochaeta sp.]|jgi:SAM-dependent methyltransferase|uniref:class I SAM-dependent methyltransferase n=1 Tax=Oceanispirochaeta sp. TaxID=2035350 RepID=UPI00261258AD|nr:methyltransferase domain-containing protein [Oceanispirochaeta sp.]MDA3959044.1 methyltransferase domain-containing protein [Oceanispirochaeta sp.]
MNKKVFNTDKLHKLNDPVRLNWLPPREIWTFLNLKNPKVLVDFGAGTGFFTSRMAVFAPEADIHAMDIQPEMIDYLQEHMPDTVSPMLLRGNTIPLADNSVDALWNIAVYHELEDRDIFLAEVFRILKPDGKLLIIDWEKEEPVLDAGPPLKNRISGKKIIEEVRDSGFREIRTMVTLNSHIGICGTKPQ